MKRTPLRRVSKKRAGQNAIYSKLRKKFLEDRIGDCCPVMWTLKGIQVPCTEIHHKAGRENELLNDVSQWLAVSRNGHLLVHASPNQAREHGWLV